MLKKFVSIALLIALFISSGFASVGEQKDLIKIGSKEYILETVETAKGVTMFEKMEGVVELEPFSPRGLSPVKSELETSAERGKLIGQIRLDKEAGKYTKDKIIPIRVVLNFDEDVVERFEKEFDRLFGNTLQYEKTKQNDYDVNVTIEQLEILEQMEEVLFICEPSEEPVGFETENIEVSGEFTINMNAASEMLGVKKARSDFGVTGDLDGNETRYTKNDVVIAIVDSGIDTSHVDLDGGKVIGWYDAVNGETSPYDDRGHGTRVASIAAGTGEGDPGIQTGIAPGAALVGVKVLDQNGKGTLRNMVNGLKWIYNNLDTYNINVVNMSIGTLDEYSVVREVITEINRIDAAGVPVFVSAGNYGNGRDSNGNFLGRYYNTLGTFAKYTDTPVGSIKDPYEGGWGLSEFSSRGTGSSGPYIVAPGEAIRSSLAGSTNEYTTRSGTSYAAPMVAGTYALMYDAAYTAGGGTIRFSAADMGEAGIDKNYGGGRLLAYESIRNAGGFSGSFNPYRTYIVDQNGYINQGLARLYPIRCNSSTGDLNITMIVTDEGMQDLGIAVWEPGVDPYTGAIATYFINHEEPGMPQESLSISRPKIGTYYIAVVGVGDSANYTLEITGHQLEIQ